jgi:dihydropteroate synthase
MGAKDTSFYQKNTLNINGRIINLDEPAVMGILNVTDNSFFDGGKYVTEKEVLNRAGEIFSEGAMFIDIGACSTRPGSIPVSVEEEMKRLLPAIKLVRKYYPDIIISADTFRSEVAKASIEAGADIINDVSGGEMDEKMFDVVAELSVPYVLMHLKGTPQTMQENPLYDNAVNEVFTYLGNKVMQLQSMGIKDIIIDPGFGFGKSVEHNYSLLKNLNVFNELNCPILVGISRKSMINKVLNIKPENAINGTIAANTIALMNGAKILRVHDVKPAVEAVKIVQTYKKS